MRMRTTLTEQRSSRTNIYVLFRSPNTAGKLTYVFRILCSVNFLPTCLRTLATNRGVPIVTYAIKNSTKLRGPTRYLTTSCQMQHALSNLALVTNPAGQSPSSERSAASMVKSLFTFYGIRSINTVSIQSRHYMYPAPDK